MSSPYYRSPHWRTLRQQALHRDHGRCVFCNEVGNIVDHIERRPQGAENPTTADRLDNLRTLCRKHDNMLKERKNGLRARNGELRGCDAEGWPLAKSRR